MWILRHKLYSFRFEQFILITWWWTLEEFENVRNIKASLLILELHFGVYIWILRFLYNCANFFGIIVFSLFQNYFTACGSTFQGDSRLGPHSVGTHMAAQRLWLGCFLSRAWGSSPCFHKGKNEIPYICRVSLKRSLNFPILKNDKPQKTVSSVFGRLRMVARPPTELGPNLDSPHFSRDLQVIIEQVLMTPWSSDV
jgi:hypothetical protein